LEIERERRSWEGGRRNQGEEEGWNSPKIAISLDYFARLGKGRSIFSFLFVMKR
jgi:hypothetical protein